MQAEIDLATTVVKALEPDPISTGPIVLGTVLQTLCQGVIFAQALKYWQSPLDDTRRMKIYVVVLVLLSVFQTALSIYKEWLVLVLHKHWSTSHLSWSELFFNGLICCVCELFLIRRCWKATQKNIWVGLVLAAIAISTFVANLFLAIAIAIGSRHQAANNDPLKTNRYFPTVFAFNFWIAGSLVLDTTVTSILMVYLWRSKTGLGYLDKALKHIIGITWESAAFPCICMLVAISLYHSKPSKDRNLVLLFILLTGKFYILGLLRTLNSRGKLRAHMKSDIGRRSLSEWQWDQEHGMGAAAAFPEAAISPTGVATSYGHRGTEATLIVDDEGKSSFKCEEKGENVVDAPSGSGDLLPVHSSRTSDSCGGM
ncbi:hypothetical protein DENSPDRAFT_811748 [Dentipellis sp. KUC8613]|nr:hypothetical protein DENSPDRAFT_811748 [Dentipellis sp. KUC8613]